MMLLMKTSVLNITRITIRASFQTSPPLLLLPRSRTKEQAASFTTMGLPVVSATHASLRVDRIGGHMTELLEVHAERPAFQVLFIPGNPGVVAYYQEYLEALYDCLDGRASITAISHVAHVSTDWEHGRLFSLQDQVDHKIRFVRELLIENAELPLLLVGHSIGAYITMEIYKRFPSKVQHIIGLYPFVTLNTQSKWQLTLRRIAETYALCKLFSNFAGLVRHFPQGLSRGIVKIFLGRVWGSLALDVTCQYLLQVMPSRKSLDLCEVDLKLDFEKSKEERSTVMCQFAQPRQQTPRVRWYTILCTWEGPSLQHVQLPTEPDWEFLRENERKISLLFGTNDHWGPLTLLQQISKEVPQLNVATEREGHLHAFCCTKAGSDWVAHYTAETILSRTTCA